jgi:phosphate transport system protein
MERHFHKQLQDLKETLFKMASLVETSIAKAVESLVHRDNTLADEVIQSDSSIDDLEILVDEQCLKLLALQQPMALDLRFLTSAMRINSGLERIGDHAVNIAERAKILNKEDLLKPLIDLPKLAQLAQSMVKESLDSFVNGDVSKARAVCIRDDVVDRLDDQIFNELYAYMVNDSENILRSLHLILISKNLERIADLSTNIAEEVIFIYKAQTIKHHVGIKSKKSRS